MKNYEEYFNAVEVVCGECCEDVEYCEKCPVKKRHDELLNDYLEETEE